VLVLGIETSCDETAAAVVADGSEMRSNIIASQHAIHAAYGGVVPELACRSHIENLQPVLAAALEQAHVTLGDIDVLAVTCNDGGTSRQSSGLIRSTATRFQIPLAIPGDEDQQLGGNAPAQTTPLHHRQ